MDGIEYLVGRLQEFLSGVMSDGALKDLVVGGIVGGVGSVIVFCRTYCCCFCSYRCSKIRDIWRGRLS